MWQTSPQEKRRVGYGERDRYKQSEQDEEEEDAGSQEELARKIKELQRGNGKAKQQWIAYTDQHCNGIRDPNKHPAELLASFMAQMNAGVLPPLNDRDGGGKGGGGGDTTEDGALLGETVKLMQRKSMIFKNVWASYCAMNGNGRNDPFRHDQGYLEKFFEYLAQMTHTVNASVMAQGPVHYIAAEPPMKRMRVDGGGATGVGSGDPRKDQLVQQIKTFQRQGEQQKETWGRYVDTYLGGVRDPSRHDFTTLMDFVRAYNLQGPSERQGHHMSAAPSGMDPLKDQLVARVKTFQKTSKEEWYAFCGATRDPARHDVSRLEEFCRLHGC